MNFAILNSSDLLDWKNKNKPLLFSEVPLFRFSTQKKIENLMPIRVGKPRNRVKHMRYIFRIA